MTPTRLWSLVTAVTVAVVLGGGWFLLVAPKRSEAADLRDQTQVQLAANDTLALRIEQLAAQYEQLPAERARLAELRRNIPATPALPALIRDLSAAARASGAELVSVAPGTITPLVQGGTPVAAPTPAAGAEGSTEAPAAAPTAALQYIPVTLTTEGSFVALKRFLHGLEELDRSFLVTGIAANVTSDEESVTTELTSTVQGRVFLNRGATTTGAATPAAAPTTPAAS